MVELILGSFATGRLWLRATRQIEGKRWVFDTVIPRAQWEDLFSVNVPAGPKMNSVKAYNHARAFWDHLADQKADELLGGVDPASPNRRIEYVWPDFGLLERAYIEFQN